MNNHKNASNKPIIIFGNSESAELTQFYFKHDSDYKVVAFCVDSAYLTSSNYCDLPMIAFEEVIKEFPPEKYNMFIAVGYNQLNQLRREKYQQAKIKGYHLVSYICSKATTWPGLVIGDNCFIFEDNTIQPFTKIGNNVTMWSGNHFGHHSIIEDNCFITSHVVISGGVIVKENTFIGVNATLRDHIVVEKNNIIAAGALIVKNTQENGLYAGAPAKCIKSVTEVEKI